MDTDPTPNQPDQDFASRAEFRIDTKGVKCTTDFATTRVADLTGNGMRLAVPANKLPEIGDTASYTFTDKGSDHQLTVQGIVRWVRKGSVLTRKAEIGIEFIDLPASHRDALVRLAVQGELLISNDPDSDPEAEQTKQAVNINLYEILTVSAYASENEIKAAFHKLVKQWHPDHNDDPQAPTRFEEVHKAYSVLRDPTLRAKYDARFGPDQASDQAAA